MEHLIYKDSRGAIQADAHYLESGHKIVVTGEWRECNVRGNKVVKKKHYKCTQCNFQSYAAELIEKN
jgi:hypothetical protein